MKSPGRLVGAFAFESSLRSCYTYTWSNLAQGSFLFLSGTLPGSFLHQTLDPENQKQRNKVDSDELLAEVGADAEVKRGEGQPELKDPAFDHIHAKTNAQACYILKAIGSKREVHYLQQLVDEREHEAAFVVTEEHASAKNGKNVKSAGEKTDAQCCLVNKHFAAEHHPQGEGYT